MSGARESLKYTPVSIMMGNTRAILNGNPNREAVVEIAHSKGLPCPLIFQKPEVE